MTQIRKLAVSDYESFRQLRQCHLETDPQSVSTSADQWRVAPREKIEALLTTEGSRADDFILGGFLENDLVGMIGFKRETRKPSTMHKGAFWGFFVRPEVRNRGIGKSLLKSSLSIVKNLEWCEMIRVMISTTDLPAIHVAESFGFTNYGKEAKSLKINGEYYDDLYYNLYFERARIDE